MPTFRRALLCLGLSLFTMATAQADDASDLAHFLDGYVPRELQRSEIAGAAVAIVKDGQLLVARGYGFADRDKQRPVSAADTLFRVGSISKLLTWTAVMQQVEKGQLDLDADVQTYLDFPLRQDRFPQPITLRQLASHRAGFEETLGQLWATTSQPTPLRDYLVHNQPERIYAPGARPAYSNYGVALAGYVLAHRSGQRFESLMQQQVLQPLGMLHSSFAQPLPKALAAQVSQGYADAHSPAREFETINVAPAGSLSATAEDMARFMLFALGDAPNPRVLKPETLAAMQAAQYRFTPGAPALGIGYYEEQGWPRRVIGHGGDSQDFHSYVYLVPELRLGVFITQNSTGKASMRRDLFGRLLERFVPPSPSVKTVAAGAPETGLEGWYLNSRRGESHPLLATALSSELKLERDKEGRLSSADLKGRDGRVLHFQPQGQGVWQAEEDPLQRLHFRKSPDGPGWEMVNGQSLMAYQQVPWWRSAPWYRGLLSVSLGVAAVSLLAWPLAAIARRRYRIQPLTEPRQRRARRWVRVTCGLILAPVLMLGALLVVDDSFAQLLSGGGPLVLRACQGVSWLLVPAIAATAWALGLSLRQPGTWWGRRLHYAAVLLAAVVQLGVMCWLNLPGWSGLM